MRALVVDDSQLVRREIGKVLESAGYACDYAANGIEAIKLGLRSRYDIILSDLTMPLLDGLKFVRRIRLSERNADTPVLILSARQDRDSVREARDLEVQGYILKPVEKEDLLARVRRALGRD